MSLNERLYRYFAARPYQWVDGRSLASIAGSYAWRTRVSNLRTVYGLKIVNGQKRLKPFRDRPTYTLSAYMFLPDARRKPPVEL